MNAKGNASRFKEKEVIDIIGYLYKLKVTLLVLLIVMILACISLLLLSNNKRNHYENGIYVYQYQTEVDYAKAI